MIKEKKYYWILLVLIFAVFYLGIRNIYYPNYKNFGRIDKLPSEIKSKINLEYYNKLNNDLIDGYKSEWVTTKHICGEGKSYGYDVLYKENTKIIELRNSVSNKVWAEILGVKKEGNYLLIKEFVYNSGYTIVGCSTDSYKPYYFGPKLGLSVYSFEEKKLIFRQILKNIDIKDFDNDKGYGLSFSHIFD